MLDIQSANERFQQRCIVEIVQSWKLR